jgi:lysozyme
MQRGNPENVDSALPEVFKVFRRDLAKFEDRVRAAVKVPLAQHEFDALVSFDFNTGGIHRAKITEHLNSGDRAAAARAFMGWLRPPEIRSRRESEMKLFRDGVYPTGLVAVYGVTGDNKPDFRQVRKRLTQDQVLTHMRPLKKDRKTAAQSTTVQASGAQILAGVGTAATAVGALDGNAQIAVLILAGVVILAGVWVMRERLRKWANGDH